MDTKRRPRAGTAGSDEEGRDRRASLGPAVLALVGTALIAVAVATIWAARAPSEDRAVPAGLPAPSAPAATTEPGPRATIYLWEPGNGGGHTVASLDVVPTGAEFFRKGDRVVYAAEGADGISQIYLVEPGEAERALTDLHGGASEPTWSPDGRRIAFSASRRVGDDTDIYVMHADGSRLRRWLGTPRDDGAPDWSPDGSTIAFDVRYESSAGLPGAAIVTGDVGTEERTRLTPPHTRFGATDPAWSPDGRWVAYSRYDRTTVNGQVSRADIWLMRANGTARSRAAKRAPGGWHLAQDPSWSPDGRLIVAEVFEEGEGTNIVIIDPRLARERRVVETATDPSWSEDGVLMTLRGYPPTFVGPAPDGFRALRGVDATIMMTNSACHLGASSGVVRPGGLTLELVNDSKLDGRFTVIRLAPGQTVANLAADPGLVVSLGMSELRSSVVHVTARDTDTASFGQVVAGDRWAVACWKDFLPAPNGFFFKPFRIASFTVTEGITSEGGA